MPEGADQDDVASWQYEVANGDTRKGFVEWFTDMKEELDHFDEEWIVEDRLTQEEPDVYVLTVTHRHGVNVTLHGSRELAHAQLGKYIDDGWDPEWPDQPLDTMEAVAMFFDRTPDEHWMIETHGVER
jgi:hypothetical protein